MFDPDYIPDTLFRCSVCGRWVEEGDPPHPHKKRRDTDVVDEEGRAPMTAD